MARQWRIADAIPLVQFVDQVVGVQGDCLGQDGLYQDS
jgi:hypothetical protein